MILLAALFSAAAVGAPPQVLPDCLGKPQVRPAQIVLACADANFGVKGLRWTGWGQSFAAATGTAYANDCTPNCAAGHFHTYRAVVVASGTQRCKNGKRAYKEVTIAFVGPSPYPKGKPSDFVYPARCA
jgi:hypothetical protein